ncbi:MAG: hypothetical protein M1820_004230 [Bogoriella megaspora]|nr:MAG: hypothetical protein M1820_004230 [Bogoriella megaspora]
MTLLSSSLRATVFEVPLVKMLDVGVAAAVLGIIEVGITTCSGIITYYRNLKDANIDSERMKDTVGQLRRAFVLISQVIRDPRFSQDIRDAIELTAPPNASLFQKAKAHLSQAAYPLEQKTLEKLENTSSKLLDTLGLAMNRLQIDIATTAVDRVENLKVQLLDFQTIVDEIKAQTDAWDASGKDMKILSLLDRYSPLSEIFGNKHSDLINEDGRQSGLFKQLQNTEKFKLWLTTPGTVLWCTGNPGTGKTVLTSFIIDYLEKEFQHTDVGVAFAYCRYVDSGSLNARDILAALLRDLAVQQRQGNEHLKRILSEHDRNKRTPSLSQIIDLLRRSVNSFQRTYIVVDALDECPEVECREQLIKSLQSLLPGACLFVTSRPIPNIEQQLRVLKAECLPVQANNSDIRNYVSMSIDCCTGLSSLCMRNDQLRENIVSTVCQKTEGMFLMARRYMDLLRSELNARDVKEALDRLPGGLDATYKETLERINRSKKPERAMEALKWIVFSLRPLLIGELQHALATRPGDVEFDLEGVDQPEEIISICQGLVVLEGHSQTVRLVHYTAKEYFEKYETELFPCGHEDIAITCLRYLVLKNIHPQFLEKNWADHKIEWKNRNHKSLEDMYLLHISAQDILLQHFSDLSRPFAASPTSLLLGLLVCIWFRLPDLVSAFIEHGAEVNATFLENELDEIEAYFWLEEQDNINAPIEPIEPLTPMVFHCRDVVDNVGVPGYTHRLSRYVHTHLERLKYEHGRRECGHRRCECGHRRCECERIALKWHVSFLLFHAGFRDAAPLPPRIEGSISSSRDKITEILIRNGANLNITLNNQTPLCFAIQNGYTETGRLLLRSGADPNLGCPLSDAISLKIQDRIMAIRALLMYGSDPNADCPHRSGDHCGWGYRQPHSLIVDVVAEDSTEVLKEFLHHRIIDMEAEYDVNTYGIGTDRATAVHIASFHCAYENLKLLVNSGANIRATTALGRSAIHCLASGCGETSDKRISETLRLLLDEKVPISLTDSLGMTALHYLAPDEGELACWPSGRFNTAKLFVSTGADIESRDSEGRTPLFHFGVSRAEEARALIQSGANVDAQDNKGWTALHFAASSVKSRIIDTHGNPRGITYEDHKTARDCVKLVGTDELHQEVIDAETENVRLWLTLFMDNCELEEQERDEIREALASHFEKPFEPNKRFAHWVNPFRPGTRAFDELRQNQDLPLDSPAIADFWYNMSEVD